MALTGSRVTAVYDQLVEAETFAVPPGQVAITDKEFRNLREFIHVHTGIALSDQKRALVCSRLGKRLRFHGLRRYQDYYELLTEHDPDGIELGEMINAITTNKTDFFREPHHFKYLAEHVFPVWRERGLTVSDARRYRIWSAGSSSGEEAYSIAVTVRESFPDLQNWDLKILATDIDTNMLNRAESGMYPEEHAERIPEPWRRRYFLKGHGPHERQMMVKPELQSLIRFRRLNLMQEPWPMRGLFDIIFCRNVIIYFDKPTQQQLIARFAAQLKPNGLLMLGHSESLHGITTAFQFVSQSIYQLARRG